MSKSASVCNAVAELAPDELEMLRHYWPLWARAKQVAPAVGVG